MNLKTKSTLLQDMIKIPVSQPTWYNQCGQWSIVYPSSFTLKQKAKREYTRKESSTYRQTNKESKKSK